MEPEFWQQRWRQNQIGFHLDRVNPVLVNHWNRLQLAPQSTVLVPLCGKSLDLIWLANQGHHVVGVECSEVAVQAFFDEQKLSCRQGEYRGFRVFSAGNISILQGDYFDLDREFLEDVAAVYDRAALVAMPFSMRENYVARLQSHLPSHSQILLVTLKYNQQLMSGPPFSVSDDEVHALYQHQFDINLIHHQDILSHQQRFAERGLDYLHESVFHLQHR